MLSWTRTFECLLSLSFHLFGLEAPTNQWRKEAGVSEATLSRAPICLSASHLRPWTAACTGNSVCSLWPYFHLVCCSTPIWKPFLRTWKYPSICFCLYSVFIILIRIPQGQIPLPLPLVFFFLCAPHREPDHKHARRLKWHACKYCCTSRAQALGFSALLMAPLSAVSKQTNISPTTFYNVWHSLDLQF